VDVSGFCGSLVNDEHVATVPYYVDTANLLLSLGKMGSTTLFDDRSSINREVSQQIKILEKS
jgi:hypothetical protein